MASDHEYYDDDMPPDECDHDDYEADILTGRAVCTMCRYSWYQTLDQIRRDEERQRDYARLCEQWDQEAAFEAPSPTDSEG